LKHRESDIASLVRKTFCAVFCPCKDRRLTRVATWHFQGVVSNVVFQSNGDSMSLTVKDTDVPGTVDVTIAFKDAKGRAAKVDGVPTWVASDTSIVDNITPAADGLSAKLHVTDNTGASQVTVSADVDLGSGVTSTDFVDTVSVIAGDAVAAEFSFGAVTHD
jgi:hypothetical protein